MTAINVEVNTNERMKKNATQFANAISRWILSHKKDKIIIGFHANKLSKTIAEEMVKVFGAYNFRVNFATEPITNDMMNKGIILTKSTLGIFVSAKNNNPILKSISLKSNNGKPLANHNMNAIQQYLDSPLENDRLDLDEMMDEGLLNYIDLKILQKIASQI